MPTEDRTKARLKREATTLAASGDVQLLTFKLDEQEYALSIAHVVQVVRMVAVTHAPKAPEFVEGMINLRGKVIPVINIRRRCGLPDKPFDLNTQLLIARTTGRMLALMVDTVSEVLTVPAANVVPPDQIGPELAHLSAVGKLDDRLILVLDPRTLLTDEEAKGL